ncbi:MAG: leucine-rich repeat domain-containing protein [Pirellulales bacterium]
MSRLLPSKNVVLLGGVLLLGVAARMYGERAYASATRFDFHPPRDVDDAETWATICIAAVVGSLIGAALGYRLNRVTAAIMGPVGAAVATAHYSSILGGILGAPVGLLVAWLGSRRLVIVTATTAAATITGVCGGAAVGALSIGPVEPVAVVATILLVIGAVAVLNVLASKRFSSGGEGKPWRRGAGLLALATITLTSAIMSVPLGITLDSRYWLQSRGVSSYMEFRPLDVRCFTYGFGQPGGWDDARRFRADDLQKLCRFDGMVDLRLIDADDDSLDLMDHWSGLRYLGLSETHITDSGIPHLTALRWLSGLDLSGTRVSGATFAQLPPSLTNLRLARSAVTDESLKHLAKLPWLDALHFTDTRIGDAGVANLAGAIRLQSLDVSGTQVTDAALASIARNHPSVQRIELRRTRITAAGLAHLTASPKLYALVLRDCTIGDEAIEALIRCRSLRTLDLIGTRVTPAGVDHLRDALPDCFVYRGEDQP